MASGACVYIMEKLCVKDSNAKSTREKAKTTLSRKYCPNMVKRSGTSRCFYLWAASKQLLKVSDCFFHFTSLHLFHKFFRICANLQLNFFSIGNWLVSLIDRTHDTRREMIFNDLSICFLKKKMYFFPNCVNGRWIWVEGEEIALIAIKTSLKLRNSLLIDANVKSYSYILWVNNLSTYFEAGISLSLVNEWKTQQMASISLEILMN